MNIIENIQKTFIALSIVVALVNTHVALANIQNPGNGTVAPAASSTIINKTNINTATAEAIAGKVKGIGLKRAEAIVSYRNAHGAYKSLKDLALVKGLGESFVKSHWEELNQAFSLS